MKQTDFDRLKALCEKEGFEILNLTHDDNEKYVLVKKVKKRFKVEFLDFDYQIEQGMIPKVKFQFWMNPVGDLNDAGEFIASKLEEYLNKE